MVASRAPERAPVRVRRRVGSSEIVFRAPQTPCPSVVAVRARLRTRRAPKLSQLFRSPGTGRGRAGSPFASDAEGRSRRRKRAPKSTRVCASARRCANGFVRYWRQRRVTKKNNRYIRPNFAERDTRRRELTSLRLSRGRLLVLRAHASIVQRASGKLLEYAYRCGPSLFLAIFFSFIPSPLSHSFAYPS